MSKKAQQLAARYGRKTDIIEIVKEIIEENYHVNAFNNPDYPIITCDEQIQDFKWGLIPFWTKTENDAQHIRKMTYNAKAETIFKLPSFREPIKSKRCLVPSTGYFEWHHDGDKKIPYFIYLKEEEIFSMAGIYDIWEEHQTGEILQSFSIITTHANPLTSYIHNNKKRMPVIISIEEEEKWLDPKLSQSQIEEMLKPFDEKKMDAYVIHKDFIRKNPKDKSIIEAA